MSSFAHPHVVELSSDDLVEAGRTSELLGARVLLDGRVLGDWFVRSGAYPAFPSPPTMELPVVPIARHPHAAFALLFAVMAACVVIAAFATTVAYASHETKAAAVASTATVRKAAPRATAAPTIAPIVAPHTDTSTVNVYDLPRAKGKKPGRP